MRNEMWTKVMVMSFVCFFSSEALCQDADTIKEEIKKICVADPDACQEQWRLSAYQPNYAIWQSTEDDEDSLEVHYSFRYLFNIQECRVSEYLLGKIDGKETLTCLKSYATRAEFYFTYTGEFDFYLATRASGPVINRVSNPAMHARQYLDNHRLFPGTMLRWFELAAEHRSDGQVVEADERVTDPSSADYGRYKTQVEYEAGNHEYFDAISRGANYISLEGKFEIGGYYDQERPQCKDTLRCFDLWISVKPYYATQDSDITWGPLADKGLKVADYDRVKIVLANTFPTGLTWLNEPEVSGTWTVGDEVNDTDSFDVDLFLPIDLEGWWRLPFYIRYHSGPMGTLSNYTQEQNSIGIGIKLR